MKNIRYLTIIIACLPSLSGTATAALSETGEMLDGIAAVVNEGVVLHSELEAQTEAIRQRAAAGGLQLPPENILKEQVLERLIVEQVQMQRADRYGIVISDQMVNSALARLAQQNNIPFEQLPQILAADGIDYAEYRRNVRKQLTLEQLRQIDVINRITVAPREIEQCIASIENDVVGNSEYNLSHILISVPQSATAEQFDEAEARARDIYQQLQAGADFGELAVTYSNSETGLEGGSLGWRKGDQLPTLFSDVVAEMEEGEISEPIRAVSGFHIVKINDMRGASERSEVEQMNVRHILITPNEIIDDQTAKQQLDDAVQRLQDGESFAELAKLLSDDPGSADEGGNLGWRGPGTFVPEFEEIANNSELGEVSEPFRSRFGWHILEVLDRRTYDNTEEVKENNCRERVQNSKLANESELWIRRLRDEAYVETRI